MQGMCTCVGVHVGVWAFVRFACAAYLETAASCVFMGARMVLNVKP